MQSFGDRRILGWAGMGVMALLFLGNWGVQALRPARQVGVGPGTPGEVVVQVVGAVRHPGVVRMPAGSRVGDAVDRAGGGTQDADLSRVNLAARATDGTQIRIPSVTDPEPVGLDSGAAAVGQATGVPAGAAGFVSSPAAEPAAALPTDPGGGVSINSGGQADLESLPGIGPALAGRILAYRQANGPFRTIDELDRVKGIGPKTLEKLRPYLRL